MKTINTSELNGSALDWAVGYVRCLAVTEGKPVLARDLMVKALRNGMASPSTDWSQGGPIIEREMISVVCDEGGTEWQAITNAARNSMFGPEFCGVFWNNGPTPLIAAMRCYVASKLGDTVDIPAELL